MPSWTSSTILSPAVKQQPGRPKKMRVRGPNEPKRTNSNKASRKGQDNHCRKCLQIGHNVRHAIILLIRSLAYIRGLQHPREKEAYQELEMLVWLDKLEETRARKFNRTLYAPPRHHPRWFASVFTYLLVILKKVTLPLVEASQTQECASDPTLRKQFLEAKAYQWKKEKMPA